MSFNYFYRSVHLIIDHVIFFLWTQFHVTNKYPLNCFHVGHELIGILLILLFWDILSEYVWVILLWWHKIISTTPSTIYSLIKWYLTSICLVLTLCLALFPRKIAPTLSQWTTIGRLISILRNSIIILISIICEHTSETATYSASVDDSVTCFCALAVLQVWLVDNNIKWLK